VFDTKACLAHHPLSVPLRLGLDPNGPILGVGHGRLGRLLGQDERAVEELAG
jgi:hypothetical protein